MNTAINNMYNRAFKIISISGLCLTLSFAIFVSNASASHLEKDEWLYALIVAFFVLIILPAALTAKVISYFRRETSPPLSKKTKSILFCAFVALIPLCFPSIYNQYILIQYNLSTEWEFGSGTANFTNIKKGGKIICTTFSASTIKFSDKNDDGHIDIVIGNEPNQVLYYSASKKSFEGCPYLGG